MARFMLDTNTVIDIRRGNRAVIDRFIGLLKRIAPDTPERQIYWFYHLLSGSLTLSLAQTGRIDVLSGGLCKSSEMAAICDAMEVIFTGGFEAMSRLPK